MINKIFYTLVFAMDKYVTVTGYLRSREMFVVMQIDVSIVHLFAEGGRQVLKIPISRMTNRL